MESSHIIRQGDIVKITEFDDIIQEYVVESIQQIDTDLCHIQLISKTGNIPNEILRILNKIPDIEGKILKSIRYLPGESYNQNIYITGNLDIDIIILMHLDHDSLSKVCQTNIYISNLCRQVVWQMKVSTDYPGSEKFKSSNRSWVNYYKSLNYTHFAIYHFHVRNAMSKAVELRDLDIVKFLVDKNPKLLMGDISESFGMDGFLEGLKWLHKIKPGAMTMDEDNEEITYLTLSEAAGNNHLDILQWAKSELDPSIFNDVDIATGIANQALLEGHIKILKWLYSLTPSVEATGERQEYLSDSGWEIFVWLVENYTDGNDHITWSDVEDALENNKIDILDFIYLRQPEYFIKEDYTYTHLTINDETREWSQTHWRHFDE